MVLVIAVDKDNDYGRKGGVGCPVIGYDAVLKAVNALGVADPEDSDANVGFAALKIAGEVGGVPVIVCGEGKGSFRDDLEVSRELDLLRERFGEAEVIIVTDGAEDESVIPLVSSRFNVVGVERVTVKQAEGVETLYYIVVKYLKEILSSRETSKVFLGIPGLVVLLVGVSIIVSTWYPGFYSAVKNSIVGLGLLLFGGYAFKVGFGVDYNRSVKKDFITVSTWLVVLFTLAIGLLKSYQVYSSGGSVVDFVYHCVRFAFLAVIVYVGGKIVSEYMNGRERQYYYLSFFAFVPAVYVGVLLIMKYVFFGSVGTVALAAYLAAIVFFVVLSGAVYRRGRKR